MGQGWHRRCQWQPPHFPGFRICRRHTGLESISRRQAKSLDLFQEDQDCSFYRSVTTATIDHDLWWLIGPLPADGPIQCLLSVPPNKRGRPVENVSQVLRRPAFSYWTLITSLNPQRTRHQPPPLVAWPQIFNLETTVYWWVCLWNSDLWRSEMCYMLRSSLWLWGSSHIFPLQCSTR